ncbi:MAG: 16S rRNA (cytidine(1402)-2'-O)-methyltransferase [Clostridia bacterium]|nr:16S rRNA (cytidine(1402)-2'-O)-methyltransferase [Clostridia bacterium]
MSGELYIVGTPIGNLGDLSLRAAKTLESVDFIAAEDTRVTLKLLNHLGIKKPMVSYFEHNKRERGEIITARIAAGENCALVTDAGMPAISDPGEDLAALCHEKGIKINSVPGPTAFATALALSGMPTGRFCFEGFLSVSNKSRKAHLESIRDETRTIVFYEAPHKLARTLQDLYDTLGERQIAIVREITKIHEEVIRTDLKTAAAQYGDGHLKGEIVLIIEGKQPPQSVYTLEDAVSMAQEYIAQSMGINEAAKRAAKETNIKKSEIYKRLNDK